MTSRSPEIEGPRSGSPDRGRPGSQPTPTDADQGGEGPEPGRQIDRTRSEPGPVAEAGFMAVEWVAAIVFLLIPVVLIGAGLSRWPERQQVARAAAAEAARVAVLSDSQTEAFARANRVADTVAANYGVPTGEIQVQVDAGRWDWGEDVTVTVTVGIPALDVPGLGSWSPGTWSTSSTQRIEDHRGLE